MVTASAPCRRWQQLSHSLTPEIWSDAVWRICTIQKRTMQGEVSWDEQVEISQTACCNGLQQALAHTNNCPIAGNWWLMTKWFRPWTSICSTGDLLRCTSTPLRHGTWPAYRALKGFASKHIHYCTSCDLAVLFVFFCSHTTHWELILTKMNKV